MLKQERENPDIPADSDDALMLRVQDRDSDAFRVLIDRHADVPFRIGCRMMGDSSEAEDIAQEAMLRLWNGADSWRGQGPGVAAWLTRVATNLCIDRLRKARRISGDEPPDSIDEAPPADALVDEDKQARAVRECIGKLGDRQRAAVILTYYEEQPNAAAADDLAMKIKAFESLLFRARKALKDCLEASPYIDRATGDQS